MKRIFKSSGLGRLKGLAAGMVLLSAFPICESPSDYNSGYPNGSGYIIKECGTIAGHVLEYGTDKPLFAAFVGHDLLSEMVRTDSTGFYIYGGAIEGENTIIAAKPGYQNDTATVYVEAGKTTIYDFHLKKK
jgi:hypothetical protein